MTHVILGAEYAPVAEAIPILLKGGMTGAIIYFLYVRLARPWKNPWCVTTPKRYLWATGFALSVAVTLVFCLFLAIWNEAGGCREYGQEVGPIDYMLARSMHLRSDHVRDVIEAQLCYVVASSLAAAVFIVNFAARWRKNRELWYAAVPRKVWTCWNCGYDLTGVPANRVCPECGYN